MITIQEIKAAGEVPESFYHIAPGCAIYYVPEDGISTRTKQLAIDLIEKCANQREGFALKIEVEPTSHPLLANTFVAKRLNLGSLYRYNLLMTSVNCQESVDAFVKEFFNLASRDDAALKYIKREPRPRYRDYDEPSFDPADMALNMIVMRPPHMVNEEEVIERDPEQIARDEKLITAILDFSNEKNEEMALELLERVAPGIYTQGDCRLICTEDYELLLKADTTVKLNLTKREAALYLFLLAHPKGIEKKRIADYKEEIADFYFILHKKPDGDKVDDTIDKLVAFKETRDGYKMKALDECTSRINKALNACIMNRTCQLPFRVENTDGVLHVDLPRKYFEWQDKELRFDIKD